MLPSQGSRHAVVRAGRLLSAAAGGINRPAAPCQPQLLTWRVPWADAESFWQIVSAVTRGERLPIPAREDLPGPDTQQVGWGWWWGLAMRHPCMPGSLARLGKRVATPPSPCTVCWAGCLLRAHAALLGAGARRPARLCRGGAGAAAPGGARRSAAAAALSGAPSRLLMWRSRPLFHSPNPLQLTHTDFNHATKCTRRDAAGLHSLRSLPFRGRGCAAHRPEGHTSRPPHRG